MYTTIKGFINNLFLVSLIINNLLIIYENLDNNEYNKENLIDELKKIKKITSDYELIRLIDKVIL